MSIAQGQLRSPPQEIMKLGIQRDFNTDSQVMRMEDDDDVGMKHYIESSEDQGNGWRSEDEIAIPPMFYASESNLGSTQSLCKAV
ncbi:hypothetical protein EC973_004300 [Apophysomyces ossiformis]|uniref:Uncharacterized protein n=1 Tax=Apophysomyces ossiformis TaxID=679940 RepID=A0A8H7BG96_9FUNG|nr:hypothetical protein EC973_004300 [Apophysomyces ossiformis]